MFVNLSNHPSSLWSEEQLQAASYWGELVDYPFPDVPPDINEKEVCKLAMDVVSEIEMMNPDAVMCQGEFTLAFAVIEKLKGLGITVVAACSERLVEERISDDGNQEKIVRFQFIQFREY